MNECSQCGFTETCVNANYQELINFARQYGSRMGFSQRFGKILLPKDETAMFYELVTGGTVKQDFSERHREYLVGQGYDFDIIDLTGDDRSMTEPKIVSEMDFYRVLERLRDVRKWMQGGVCGPL
jgi:hypothetical protein